MRDSPGLTVRRWSEEVEILRWSVHMPEERCCVCQGKDAGEEMELSAGGKKEGQKRWFMDEVSGSRWAIGLGRGQCEA